MTFSSKKASRDAYSETLDRRSKLAERGARALEALLEAPWEATILTQLLNRLEVSSLDDLAEVSDEDFVEALHEASIPF